MAGCGGGGQRVVTVTGTTFSDGSTSAQKFRPFLQVNPNEFSQAKISFEFRRIGKAKSIRSWRGSNDNGVTWSATTDVGSYDDTNPSWDAGTYFDLSDAYSVIELGLSTVNNAAGTTRDCAFVVMTVELRNK